MGKKDTKSFLLREAFKLFASKPYDKVTYIDVEKATKLSRGAILYHMANKETLFKEVIDNYILNDYSVGDVSTPTDYNSLYDFICKYLEQVEVTKRWMSINGLRNMNLALVNLSMQALYFYPEIADKGEKWLRNETQTWKGIVSEAINRGEIKSDLDAETVAIVFLTIYFGTSYAAITLPNGIELDVLKKTFLMFYNLIKN